MTFIRNLINKGKSIDWIFLFFLIGVTNVKLWLKFVAVALYCIVLLVRKVRVDSVFQRPVFFYALMPVAGLAGAFLSHAFQMKGYWLGTVFSAVNWLLCGVSFIAIYITVKTQTKEKRIITVESFFLLNAAMAAVQIISMTIACRHFPYWFQDPTGVYGISSGDHLHGLFLDNTSVTNAAICQLAVFYFLFQKKNVYALLCLIVCVLCISNLILLILLLGLGFTFVFYRGFRKTSVLYMACAVTLYLFVSPSNLYYTQHVLGKLVSEEKNEPALKTPAKANKQPVTQQPARTVKIVPSRRPTFDEREAQILADFVQLKEISAKNKIKNPTEPYQPDTLKAMMARWYGAPYEATGLATGHKFGKFYSFRQTRYYLREKWTRMLFGAGAGNFSSRMAWRGTGLNEQGGYPSKYRYISDEYLFNHFYTHMFFMAEPISEHSIINSPNSVYNQLAGEYGCVGLALFLILYISYFIRLAIRDRRKIIFVAALLFLFCFEYWFEMLTLTVFFELFMLSDLNPDPIKEIGDV